MSTEIPKSISGPRCTRRRGVKLWAVNSSALGSYGGRQPQILQFHLYQEERRARAGFRGDRAFVVLSIMQPQRSWGALTGQRTSRYDTAGCPARPPFVSRAWPNTMATARRPDSDR